MYVYALSFGIIISASVYCLISFIPLSALSILVCPSAVNGLVTTPTVKIPCSCANFAIIGAAVLLAAGTAVFAKKKGTDTDDDEDDDE